MQTFAPEGRDIVSGFQKLDRQRLGKQRVETYQILRALIGASDGWRNHPATLLWEDHIPALAQYGIVNCHVWKERGYKDSLLPKFHAIARGYPGSAQMPKFLDTIAESHRSNLIRKDPIFYGPLWPDTPPNLDYIWRV